MTTPASWPTMRIVAFFAANPAEQLHTSDLAAKFDMQHRNANAVARRLTRQQWLKVDCDETRGRERVYSAGPMLLRTIGAAR